MHFPGFDLSKNARRWIVPAFFLCFFILGLSVFKDYGVSWDEVNQRKIAVLVADYIFENDDTLLNSPHPKYHGPVIPVALFSLEKILGLEDTKAKILLWHFGNFLIYFLGIIYFYFLGVDRFKSWKPALLGSLFLILSPRIFAHAFFNHKDIPFLSLYIICIYSLIKLLEKKTTARICLHALLCAILIDIRILGVTLPFLTLLFLGIDFLLEPGKKQNLTLLLRNLTLFCFSLGMLVVLFWPSLWENPVNEIMNAYNFMKKIEWGGTVLYLGHFVKSNNLPWHYVPVWISITTPLLYLLFFFPGLLFMGSDFFRSPLEFYRKRKTDLICFLWFSLPIAAILIHKSTIFDDWRHLYFIYPAMIMISMNGLICLWKLLKRIKNRRIFFILSCLIVTLVVLSVTKTAFLMIRDHPYQNVYFNLLAGSDKRHRFELDYWGLSYKEALEYILENDKRSVIEVQVANSPGRHTKEILTKGERERLRFVKKQGDYLITNHRWHPNDYPEQEWFSIKVAGEKINTVYKLR